MGAAIISAIAAAFKAVASYLAWAREKVLVRLGKAEGTAENLQERINAMQEANRLREEARASVERDHADGVPDDDGFQRKDD